MKTLISKPKNKKDLKKRFAWFFGIIFALLALPGVLAYPLGIEMLDLYSVMVEYLFGSFWMAIFVLMAIFFVILALIGGLSLFTTVQFVMIFLVAMMIGYSRETAVIAWVALIAWSIFQVVRAGNSTSY